MIPLLLVSTLDQRNLIGLLGQIREQLEEKNQSQDVNAAREPAAPTYELPQLSVIHKGPRSIRGDETVIAKNADDSSSDWPPLRRLEAKVNDLVEVRFRDTSSHSLFRHSFVQRSGHSKVDSPEFDKHSTALKAAFDVENSLSAAREPAAAGTLLNQSGATSCASSSVAAREPADASNSVDKTILDHIIAAVISTSTREVF